MLSYRTAYLVIPRHTTRQTEGAPEDVRRYPDDATGVDYKDTLNLPKTDFPMRAGASPARARLAARWEETGL